jgi:beta-galactosidase
MALPKAFNRVEWYGRGAHESYDDRKESAFVGLYSSSLDAWQFDYDALEESGNRTDVRYFELRAADGSLLRVSGMPTVNFNMEKLPTGMTGLHIDHRQMGVGGDDSWSPRVHPEYRLTLPAYEYSFTIQVR